MISNLLAYFSTEISLLVGSLISLMLVLFVPKERKINTAIITALVVLMFGLYFEYGVFTQKAYGTLFNDFWQKTNISNLFNMILLSFGAIIMLLCFNTQSRIFLLNHYVELPVLFLFAILGMILTINANDLLALYLALELHSLTIFILIALKRESNYATEAGLKYFILSSLASALFLFGVSLIYGYVGTTNYIGLSNWADNINIMHNVSNSAIIIGIILILISFCFKLGVAPFHFWAPDVYQGSSNLVTLFLLVMPKIAVISAFAKLFGEAFANLYFIKSQLIPTMAIISLLVGALGGVLQYNFKRMIAFSSIGHIGFIFLCFIGDIVNYHALFEYLIIYSVMNIGLFALIMQLRKKDESLLFISNLSKIIKHYPFYGILISILMFSMAGIPPFAGFFIKYNILLHVIAHEKYILAIFAIVSTVISAYYYLRIIKIMYFDQEVSKLKVNFQLVTNVIVVTTVLIVTFFYFIFNYLNL